MAEAMGGGVLELEPREASNLPFPQLSHSLDIWEVDQLARTASLRDLIDVVDEGTLKPMGLTESERSLLRNIWETLSSRRHERK